MCLMRNGNWKNLSLYLLFCLGVFLWVFFFPHFFPYGRKQGNKLSLTTKFYSVSWKLSRSSGEYQVLQNQSLNCQKQANLSQQRVAVKCSVSKQLLHKEDVQMVQPFLTPLEWHSFGDKQHTPATEYVGFLRAERRLILGNTSKVTETSVVVFLSLKNPQESEREMEREI